MAIGEALYALAHGDSETAGQLLAAVVSTNPELRPALSKDPDLGHLVSEP